MIRTFSSRARRTVMAFLVITASLLALSVVPSQGAVAQQSRPSKKPTVVLVHGAWADASSWNGVTSRLLQDGYPVVAVANPLRALSNDAAYVKTFLATVTGPIILVGHSYGGAVITNAATGNPNVKALVYVNAFAPDQGESALTLAGADSALAAPPETVFDFVPATLPPAPTADLYLKKSVVNSSFAEGLGSSDKALVLATQRPVTLGLAEPSGVPAWKTIPSWSLVGTKDKIITPAAQLGMAKKAGATIVEYNAGHLGLVSAPKYAIRIIEQAAKATVRH